MQCPKCGTELSIEEITRERGYVKLPECNAEMPLAKTDEVAQSVDPHFIQGFRVGTEKQRQLAIDTGWRPVPSVEWLEQELDHIEQMEKGHWSLVAQALHDAILANCQSYFGTGRCDISGELCKEGARGESCEIKAP